MIESVITQKSQTYLSSNEDFKKPKKVALSTIGIACALATTVPVNKAITKKIRSYSNSLTENEIKQVDEGANKVLINTGLKNKGVKIEWFGDEVLEQSKKKSQQIKIKNYETLKEKIKLFQKSKPSATFYLSSNKIKLRGKGATLSVFHEIGHSMARNGSAFSKFLQKSSFLAFLAIPISSYAILKSYKKDKFKNSKSNDFIKNNAGKLVFASFIPLLIEEGRASIRGWREAKNVLSPILYKKAVKQGIGGFLTYLVPAVLSSFFTYFLCRQGEKVKK